MKRWIAIALLLVAVFFMSSTPGSSRPFPSGDFITSDYIGRLESRIERLEDEVQLLRSMLDGKGGVVWRLDEIEARQPPPWRR